MNRAIRILCNYTKGGAGKTTLAVHVAGLLMEETLGRVLLVDCDPRPDSYMFFSGQAPDPNQLSLTLEDNLVLRWNPPQPKGTRFQPITQKDYERYEYVVIDTDSPPEDALTILDETCPDIFLVPIAESQSHSIGNLSPFLSALERGVVFQRNAETRYNYNPVVKIVPLGLSFDEIEDELDVDRFNDITIQVCTPMANLASEMRKSLKEKVLIWNYQNLEDTKDYFATLIEDLI